MTIPTLITAIKAEMERQAETYRTGFVDFDPLLPANVHEDFRGWVRLGGIFDIRALAEAVEKAVGK